MRVFYIGSTGHLSLQPLLYLLNAGYEVCAVGLDLQPSPVNQSLADPLLVHEGMAIDSVARYENIPAIDLHRPAAEVVGEVGDMGPDLILVSCYARRIVNDLLNLPRLGVFNIHPSLLPVFRGPVPLFWQFRTGEEVFGLSLHRVTPRFDAGPVISSLQTRMPDGVTQAEAINRLTGLIKPLLDDALSAIGRGEGGVEQSEAYASYQAYPEAADFEISTDWTAQRIFNFMRATAHMGQPYSCRLHGMKVLLKHALAWSPDTNLNFSPDSGQTIQISCSSGTLAASYYQ